MKTKIVAIAGSAGSFSTIKDILDCLPNYINYSILICMHRGTNHSDEMQKTLAIKTNILISELKHQTLIKTNNIYIVPANYHCYINKEKYSILTTEEYYNYCRPSIDILFNSIAKFEQAATGILLSGANHDGAEGLLNIYNKGGCAIIQLPEECKFDIMPHEALKKCPQIIVYKVEKIKKYLQMLD